MMILTADGQAWDSAAFLGYKLMYVECKERGDVVMLAGYTSGDSRDPRIIAFFPRGCRELASKVLEEVVRGLTIPDVLTVMDLRTESVDPDEQMLVDAGIIEKQIATQEAEEKNEAPAPAGPRVFRLRAGHDEPQFLVRMTGRRVQKLEFGGDGTVAIVMDGPYQ